MKKENQARVKIASVCILAALLVCALLIGCTKPNDDTKKEPFDPLSNSFTVWTEDWTAVGGTIAVVDKTLAVRGGGAQKTWTLPDKADLWVDFDYLPDGKDVALKVEIEVGGVKKLMADALPVYADFGRLNYQIPFSMYYTQAEYGGKEAKLNLTAIGASESQGVRLDNVRTYTRKSAGKADEANNPMVNTFAESLEDWYIGGHFSSMDYGYQLRATVEHYYGKVRIDGSQLWTREFTPNINTSMSKYFDLPQDGRQYRMNMKVQASDKGTMIMALCIVDGKAVKVTDGWLYIHSQEESVLSCAVPKGGKKAQIILMQRDSNLNNGQSEFLFLQRFEVIPYTVDPYDNQFIIDLEDWADKNAGGDKAIEVSDGYARLKSGSAMEKTLAFPALEGSWRQSVRMFFSTSGSARVRLELKVKGETTVLYDKVCADSPLGEAAMHEFDYDFSSLLGGQTGTFTLSVGGDGAAMRLKGFRLTKKWMTNPYENRFHDSMEDWYNISRQGWDNNCAKFDNTGWQRIQIDYSQSGSGNEAGKTIFGKDYKLLDSQKIKLDFTIEGSGKNPTGYAGWFTLDMLVDGTWYTVMPKQHVIAGLPVTPYSVKLDELAALSGVAYAGQDVTLRFTFDQNPDDLEMVAFLDDFVTTIYA